MNTFEPSLAQKKYGRLLPGMLPKKARKLLRQVQNEPVVSLVVIQKPIENVVRWTMNRSGISPEWITCTTRHCGSMGDTCMKNNTSSNFKSVPKHNSWNFTI
jgi:hypothetical protein